MINIDSYDILTRIGFVVIEHFKKDSLEAELNTLISAKEKHYGDLRQSDYFG